MDDTRRSRLLRRTAIAATVLATCASGCGSGGQRQAGPSAPPAATCASQPTSTWQGASSVAGVEFPSANGKGSYGGLLFTPPPGKRFPGKRPAIVLGHGAGGDQCSQFWEARDLAGHGYIALSLGRSQAETIDDYVNALRSGVRFLRSSSNPAQARTNRKRIGLTGHSLSTPAIAVVQQDEPGVRAIASLEGLTSQYSPGPKQPKVSVKPHVPALGESADSTYPHRQQEGVDQRKIGYGTWRSAKIPTMEVVFNGFVHNDFAAPGDDARHRLEGHYVVAWFDRWLLRRRSAAKALVARKVAGRPVSSFLSGTYASSLYIPRQVRCQTLVKCRAHPR